MIKVTFRAKLTLFLDVDATQRIQTTWKTRHSDLEESLPSTLLSLDTDILTEDVFSRKDCSSSRDLKRPLISNENHVVFSCEIDLTYE